MMPIGLTSVELKVSRLHRVPLRDMVADWEDLEGTSGGESSVEYGMDSQEEECADDAIDVYEDGSEEEVACT